MLEPYLLLTDQKLNVTKTYAFAINHDEDSNITLNEQTLPISDKVKILGAKFYFYPNSVSSHYVADDFKFVEAALMRIENSGLPIWARSLVIAGFTVSKLLHGSDIRQLDDFQKRSLNNFITSTLWGLRSNKRTPGVLHTIQIKGDTVAISQAVLTSRWLKFCRTIRNDCSLRDLILKNCRLCERRKIQNQDQRQQSYNPPGDIVFFMKQALRYVAAKRSSTVVQPVGARTCATWDVIWCGDKCVRMFFVRNVHLVILYLIFTTLDAKEVLDRDHEVLQELLGKSFLLLMIHT